MATLIYASNGDQCIGKCDSTCYEATKPTCHCICRGMNHGVGLDRAIENTREHAEAWIKEYRQEHRDEMFLEVKVNHEVITQLKLF